MKDGSRCCGFSGVGGRVLLLLFLVADIALDFVCQFGLLDVSDELVEVDLVGAAALEQRVRVENSLACLGS